LKALGGGVGLLRPQFLHFTQMDDHPSSSRRKKSDKAKDKRDRTPYSSQHVRQVIANVLVAANTQADSDKKHKSQKNKKFFVFLCFIFFILFLVFI
jgi:hypothetical protein